MELEQFVQLGERSGYEGHDLQEFVHKEIARRQQTLARQVEYTERQQEHELNTLRLKIQLQEAMIRGEAAGVPVNGDRQNNHNNGVRVGPKLKIPPFEDGKDDLDAYL